MRRALLTSNVIQCTGTIFPRARFFTPVGKLSQSLSNPLMIISLTRQTLYLLLFKIWKQTDWWKLISILKYPLKPDIFDQNNFCAPITGYTWHVSAKPSHSTKSCPIQEQFVCLYGYNQSKNEGSGVESLLIMPPFLMSCLSHHCHHDTGLPLLCLAP